MSQYDNLAPIDNAASSYAMSRCLLDWILECDQTHPQDTMRLSGNGKISSAIATLSPHTTPPIAPAHHSPTMTVQTCRLLQDRREPATCRGALLSAGCCDANALLATELVLVVDGFIELEDIKQFTNGWT